MTRQVHANLDRVTPQHLRTSGFSFSDVPNGFISVGSVVDGMVTSLPRTQVPQGSCELGLNARIGDGWIGSRPGTSALSPAKPNSTGVQKIILAVNDAGDPVIVRITQSSVHILLDGAWTELTGVSLGVMAYEANEDVNGNWLFTEGISAGDTFKQDSNGNQLLDGTAAVGADQVIAKFGSQGWLLIVSSLVTNLVGLSSTQMFNSLFLADGFQQIARIDLDGQTANRISTAPVARYITTFGDRVIAANILDGSTSFPNKIQWSDNADPYTWDGSTSGEENLVQTSRGFGDHITGIFGLEDLCVILRRQSIWHMTRQPISTAPFRFQEIIGGIGCDLPFTAVNVGNGIVYADRRARGVFFYEPGARPVRISQAIDNDLRSDLEDPAWVEASYNPFRDEYHLGIKASGDKRGAFDKTWILSIRHGFKWTRDEIPGVTSFGEIVSGIDVQDDIIFDSRYLFGTTTGEIVQFDETTGDDWDASSPYCELISPNIGGLPSIRTLKDISLQLLVGLNSSVEISNGNSIGDWRNVKTDSLSSSSSFQRLNLKLSQVTGEDLYWRFRSQGQVKLYSWWARILEKSLHR